MRSAHCASRAIQNGSFGLSALLTSQSILRGPNVNMDSASSNQELGYDNLIAVQHRQQQELLKLLTQHFHNQFYQLACNEHTNHQATLDGAAANHLCPSTSAASITSHQNLLAAPTSNLNQTYPPPAPVSRNNQSPRNQTDPLLGTTRGLDLSCIDLLSAVGTSNHLKLVQEQQHALARSQQNITIPPMVNNQIISSLTDFANPGTSMIDSYQFNIMNALGLSGSNKDDHNRLAFPFKQQSIIQAIRQQQQQLQQQQQIHEESSFRDCNISDNMRDLQQRNVLRFESAPTNDGFIQEDNDQALNGKSLLKFSINTILGRNSPLANAKTDCETSTRHRRNHPGSNSDDDKFAYRNNQTAARMGPAGGHTEEDELNEDRKRTLIGGESDAANDSNSDTNSLPASTPLPQINCSSILLNQQATAQVRTSSSFTAATSTSTSISTNTITSDSLARAHQQSFRHVPQAAHLNGQHSLAPFLANSTSFPWTVTSRGKPRRGMMRRAVFSDGQRVGLEKRFQMQKYISKPDRKKLAEKLGLRDSQVKIWFQNRRMKWRNSKERELLSAGGSREQTLPTRNNPNPDLSDVGETIRRLTTTSNQVSGAINPLTAASNLTNK